MACRWRTPDTADDLRPDFCGKVTVAGTRREGGCGVSYRAKRQGLFSSLDFGSCDLSLRRKPRRGIRACARRLLRQGRLAKGHAPLSQSGDSRGALLGSRIGMVSRLQLTGAKALSELDKSAVHHCI